MSLAVSSYRKIPGDYQAVRIPQALDSFNVLEWQEHYRQMEEVARWCGGTVHDAVDADDRYHLYITVPSLECPIPAIGDYYIVRGTSGEFWPVRADIFERTYERAE